MYIKTKSGDYVNSKNIGALKIVRYAGNFNVIADCTGYGSEYCFYTSAKKEDAQAYMTLMVNRLDEVEAASMQYPRCAILKVSESTVDAARCSNRPLQNEPPRVASQNTKLSAMLNALVDDFAASGDTDNLLKINAYIRMYLQQEANHE
uniref:Uncharacterized protein n=1 Tax=Myoviridae sp. ctCop38 TaxID=2826632 RepID=A0A8S5MYU6_9CAUD|nr:MAG TPA: hypothetical protein [Myoviridae sp. ctCop38]